MKIKRVTVNLPAELAELVEARLLECPYKSESSYFIGLAIFDCWARRPHRFTATLMAQPGKQRDAAIAELAKKFKSGVGAKEPGWFDRTIEELVNKSIAATAAEKDARGSSGTKTSLPKKAKPSAASMSKKRPKK